MLCNMIYCIFAIEKQKLLNVQHYPASNSAQFLRHQLEYYVSSLHIHIRGFSNLSQIPMQR